MLRACSKEIYGWPRGLSAGVSSNSAGFCRCLKVSVRVVVERVRETKKKSMGVLMGHSGPPIQK